MRVLATAFAFAWFGVAHLRAALPVFIRDGIGLAGAALVTYGAWRVYEPAGFIVPGGMLLCVAWLMARRS
jgi:hypothetical protein